jgi:hypothetical protein
MPNSFAYLVLLSWPVVAIVLFRTLSLQQALIWTLIGGHLLLPSATSFSLPLLPDVDRGLIAALSTLILCLIFAPKNALVPDWSGRGGRTLISAFFVLLFITPFLTMLLNPDPLIYGPTFLPGLRLYDALSMVAAIGVAVVPFWIGLRYLNTLSGQRLLLQAFVFGAIAYSFPALFEVRMSPQLHTWIYGFFPHDFVQHIRSGGFRPVVFLNHGLMVGVFLCMATISSLVLWRDALRQGQTASGWLFAAIWLTFVLYFSKNLGALSLTILMGTLVFLTGRRVQAAFALVVAFVIVLYPMLRGAGAIPVDDVYDFALTIDEERAASLKFRLDNEDELLAHANERPLFGWGNWGRHQLYDETTGRMYSTTDGIWIILIGVYGWVGYIAHFGLLTLPIVFYFFRRKRLEPSLVTSGLIILLSTNLIDLIPNAGLVNYVWLMAGSLTGYALWRPREASDGDDAQVAGSPPTSQVRGAPPPPSWVMADTGPARRRARTARQRGLE